MTTTTKAPVLVAVAAVDARPARASSADKQRLYVVLPAVVSHLIDLCKAEEAVADVPTTTMTVHSMWNLAPQQRQRVCSFEAH